MSDLRLHLDDTTFEDLVVLGRSVIPALAPRWTDHNVHDPGIMLMELVASIADAQIYSLGRTRTDERTAYARLLGITPRGPQPATGLIWPNDTTATGSPPSPWPFDARIEAGTTVVADRPKVPLYRTTRDIDLIDARLTKIATRLGRETLGEWTVSNRETLATFQPFGAAPPDGVRLELTFEGSTAASPPTRASGGKRPSQIVSIGFRLAGSPADAETAPARPRLRATRIDDDGERLLAILEDTTDGLLRTGVVLLAVDAPSRGRVFTVTIGSADRSFVRSPHVVRIAANVLPVEQVESIVEPRVSGTGLPDQTHRLTRGGLVFPPPTSGRAGESDSYELRVVSGGDGGWSRVEDFDASGPDDRHFVLDSARSTLRFGNGLNGRTPPAGLALELRYAVSEGRRGSLRAGVHWAVRGFDFGANDDATAGGSDAPGFAETRALARRRLTEQRPIVTSDDLTQAALAFTDLGVARAIEVSSAAAGRHVPGSRTLCVIAEPDAESAAPGTESAVWRAEIRRRLAPRLPLGERLSVIAPRFVTLTVVARIEARPAANPADVRARAERRLREWLVPTGAAAWPLGRDVSAAALKGALRRVEGVGRVVEARLREGGRGPARDVVSIPRTGLPRLELGDRDLEVVRPPIGGAA